jgi:hypothetical protein
MEFSAPTLLDCARRLGWALNTVKRHARAATAEQLQPPPRYRCQPFTWTKSADQILAKATGGQRSSFT